MRRCRHSPRWQREKAPAEDALAEALAGLRTVDDKSYLAYALNAAARLHRQAGRVEQARVCAAEALKIALIMRRRNEITIARAMLAPSGEAASDQDLDSAEAASSDLNVLSARARSALFGPAEPARKIPTDVPTPNA